MIYDNIIEHKNDFSKSDIQDASEQLFELFKCDEGETELMNEKIEVIELFIKTLSRSLRSGLVKTKSQKAAIMKTITKLKMQQEILELLQSEDVEEAVRNLKETAERFGKKAQSSVRKAS